MLMVIRSSKKCVRSIQIHRVNWIWFSTIFVKLFTCRSSILTYFQQTSLTTRIICKSTPYPSTNTKMNTLQIKRSCCNANICEVSNKNMISLLKFIGFWRVVPASFVRNNWISQHSSPITSLTLNKTIIMQITMWY